MYIKQISILALGLILSHESFAANPAIRAGALRLNTSSSSTQSTQSVTNPSSTTGALASYERASRLRPNRVQIGAVSGGTTNNANTELLNTVYAEMERVTNAVEQELYVTQRQIDDLKEEIEERDEKIQELEEALEDYEDLKETVKNIPSVYYTKREVDAKGYVMPKTMENAINVAKTSAISSARDQAVAEIQNKGFITADTVYQDIAVAKDKAIADAKEAALVAVKDMGFATVGKLNEVVSTERAARQDALKSYATKAQVATDIENVKTAAVDDAIAAVDKRNFATISAVDSAVLGATANIREERENALKSYATKSQVASDIENVKTAAVNDAVAEVDKRGFATVSAVDGKLANLELGVDNETVTSIVDDRINAHNFATISAVDSAVLGAIVNIREERENALKSYATKEQLAADIATAKTAAVDDAVAEVDERGFVKQATADEIFATKTDLTAVDNKFKNISNTVAVDLAQNDSFKAQVLDSLDSSISELPGKVTVMETKIASLDKELFDGGVPKFAKKIDMDEFRQKLQDEPTKIIGREKLIDTEYVVGKLPATVCRTKDCLTSMIGDHYTTDSKVALKISDSLYEGGDTSKPKFTTIADREGLVARIDVVEGSFKPAVLKEKILGIKENNVNVFALKSDVDAEANARNVALSDLNTTITVVDKKFGDYTKTADLGNVNVITDKISIAKSEAISGAVAQAANERTNALKGYATTSDLTTVDGKFGDYTKTADLGNVNVITDKISIAKSEAISGAVAQAANERTNALKGYATTSDLTTVDGKFGNYTKTADLGNVQLIKNMNTNISNNTNKFANYTTTSAMNTSINNAKNAAVAQAASERDDVLSSYATQSWVNDKGYATQSWVNSTIETKVNIKDQQTPAM